MGRHGRGAGLAAHDGSAPSRAGRPHCDKGVVGRAVSAPGAPRALIRPRGARQVRGPIAPIARRGYQHSRRCVRGWRVRRSRRAMSFAGWRRESAFRLRRFEEARRAQFAKMRGASLSAAARTTSANKRRVQRLQGSSSLWRSDRAPPMREITARAPGVGVARSRHGRRPRPGFRGPRVTRPRGPASARARENKSLDVEGGGWAMGGTPNLTTSNLIKLRL